VESLAVSHTCHADGCSVEVAPAMFACLPHWRMVPKPLQRALTRVYVPGQELTKQPTRAYMLVQMRCRLAIAMKEGSRDVARAICNELRAFLAPLTFQQAPLVPGLATFSNSDLIIAVDDVIERILSGELVRPGSGPGIPPSAPALPDTRPAPRQSRLSTPASEKTWAAAPSPFPCVVLDTETTGIFGKHPWAEVIELGAVALDECGAEIAHFERYVRPTDIDDPRIDEALAINHIDRGVLYGAPDPIDVLYEFLAWMPEEVSCTSYNVVFDRRGLASMGALTIVWGPCILQRARRELPKPHKLSDVAGRLGVAPRGEPHRALTDSRTAADVLVALEKRWRRPQADRNPGAQ